MAREPGGDTQYALLPGMHRLVVRDGHDWRDIFQRTENIGYPLREAFREIDRENERRPYGMFGDAEWTKNERLPDRLFHQPPIFAG